MVGVGRLDKRAGETVGDRRTVVKMQETETGKLGRARESAVESLSAQETDKERGRATWKKGDRASRQRGMGTIKRQEMNRRERCS